MFIISRATICSSTPSTDQCVICEYYARGDNDDHLVNLQNKGIQTIKLYCEQRNAHALLKHLLYCEVNCLKVLVHAKCRRDFTDPKRQKPLTDDPVQVKQLRSSLPDFCWKTCCFFFAEKMQRLTHVIQTKISGQLKH